MRALRVVVVWLIFAGMAVGFGCGVLAQSAAGASASEASPGKGEPDAEGIYRIGGDVKPPVVTYKPAPDFGEAEKKTKERGYSGSIVIGLVVDVKGLPQQVHIVRGWAPDFDAEALVAVRQYRFKPAMKGDTPVPVSTFVRLDFQVY